MHEALRLHGPSSVSPALVGGHRQPFHRSLSITSKSGNAVGDDFEKRASSTQAFSALRPVLITVFANRARRLFPLALHGGPLWKPLCYAPDRRPC